MKNIRVFYLKNLCFLEVKFSIYLNRHVFVMGCYSKALCCKVFYSYELNSASSGIKTWNFVIHHLSCDIAHVLYYYTIFLTFKVTKFSFFFLTFKALFLRKFAAVNFLKSYLSEELRLDISARHIIHMKFQALFSLKKTTKNTHTQKKKKKTIIKHIVICCSYDLSIKERLFFFS